MKDLLGYTDSVACIGNLSIVKEFSNYAEVPKLNQLIQFWDAKIIST